MVGLQLPLISRRWTRNLRLRVDGDAFFATLNSASRYAVMYRIEEAKKPETGARRSNGFVAMLSRREQIHPVLGKKQQ